MKRIIVTITEYVRKTPRIKAVMARTTGEAINRESGYFPDGGAVASDTIAAADNLKLALDRFDAIPSEFNRSLARDAKKMCDVQMGNCMMYVQRKCNAVSDREIAAAMAFAAVLTVRKKKGRLPLPDRVEKAEAVFSNSPQTILLKIKKKPKHAQYFEIWISLNPDDENSWTLKDSTSGKKLLVKGLSTGQKYFLRIVSCNNYGKTLPALTLYQMAG